MSETVRVLVGLSAGDRDEAAVQAGAVLEEDMPELNQGTVDVVSVSQTGDDMFDVVLDLNLMAGSPSNVDEIIQNSTFFEKVDVTESG